MSEPTDSLTRALSSLSVLCAVSVALLLVACDRQSNDSSEPPPLVGEVDAQQLFMRKCAHCHGARGSGDGPGARSYASVANLRGAELQERLSDEQLSQVIAEGSGRMPPVYGLHPSEVDAIVAYIRQLSDAAQPE